MSEVVDITDRRSRDSNSRVALMRCRACRLHWYAIYYRETPTDELPCPDCDAEGGDRLGESHLVVFYEYGDL